MTRKKRLRTILMIAGPALVLIGATHFYLTTLETDGATLAARRRTVEIADRSLHLSRRSFQVGNSGILQVLDASRQYQRARLSLLDARERQFQNVARMYVATAGGWIPEERLARHQAEPGRETGRTP